MAAASLIAIGKGYAVSGDIVVTAAAPVTVGLMWTAGEALPTEKALLNIQSKDSNGAYTTFDFLADKQRDRTLAGPGTYRIERPTLSTPDGSGIGAYSA